MAVNPSAPRPAVRAPAITPALSPGGDALVPTPAACDPTREYLAGSSRGYGYFTGAHVLSQAIDDVTRAFGPELYEFMLLDAAVAGAISKLVCGVLSGGLHLIPTVRSVPGRPKTVEMQRAEDIAENNRRNLKRLTRPIEDVLKEMCYAIAFGNLIAELVQDTEPDRDGLDQLRMISPKPWWAWRFGVDAAGNVLGFIPTQGALGLASISNTAPQTVTPDPSATVLGIGPLLDPGHFALLSWDARGGSPQGNSILRPCYPWWNEKRQAIPEYRTFIRRMASPKPIAIVGNPGDMVPTIDPVTLMEIPGQQETMLTSTLKMLAKWDNNQAIALPGPSGGEAVGTTIQWYNALNQGTSFANFYEFCDRMICTAVLHSARATMEAEHSSKADAQVADESVGNIDKFIGAWLGRWLRSILYRLNVGNYGREAADDYTPEVAIGEADHQDKAALITSVSAAGYSIAPSQFAAIDAMLDLPERLPGEVATTSPGQAAGAAQGLAPGEGPGEEAEPAEDAGTDGETTQEAEDDATDPDDLETPGEEIGEHAQKGGH